MTDLTTASLPEALSTISREALQKLMDSPIPCHGWRLLRWDADIPLQESQLQALVQVLQESFSSLGQLAIHFGKDKDEGDSLHLLVRLEQYPAKAHRETVLWLAIHVFLEACDLTLEQEGVLYVGQEYPVPDTCLMAPEVPKEITEWWNCTTAFSGAEARKHRAALITHLKRHQYTMLSGYISRVLRGSSNLGPACFSFVPLVIETIWNQYPDASVSLLTKDLNLKDMARRPQEALLDWLKTLGAVLGELPSTTDTPPIERVIASIQADCALPYSQSNLSRSLGLTPAYFCRLFREKTGQHFSTFLTITRMEKAQELLAKAGQLSLQEISEACGYPNKSYFCQVFKKYTGMTPGEYSQHQSENPDR